MTSSLQTTIKNPLAALGKVGDFEPFANVALGYVRNRAQKNPLRFKTGLMLLNAAAMTPGVPLQYKIGFKAAAGLLKAATKQTAEEKHAAKMRRKVRKAQERMELRQVRLQEAVNKEENKTELANAKTGANRPIKHRRFPLAKRAPTVH